MKSFLFILLILAASTALADTYKWEDKDGGIHFTENLASVPKKYRAKAMAGASGDITIRDPEVRTDVATRSQQAKQKAKEDMKAAKRAEDEDAAKQAKSAALKRQQDAEQERLRKELKAKDPKNEYDNWKPSYHRQGYSPARVKRY